MSSLSQRIGDALGIRFTGLREAGGQHGVFGRSYTPQLVAATQAALAAR